MINKRRWVDFPQLAMSSAFPANDPNLGQRARKATQKATNNPELDSLRRAPKAATCATDLDEDDPQPTLLKRKNPPKKRPVPTSDSESNDGEGPITMSKAMLRAKRLQLVEDDGGDDRDGLASDGDEDEDGEGNGGPVEELSLQEHLGEPTRFLELFLGRNS